MTSCQFCNKLESEVDLYRHHEKAYPTLATKGGPVCRACINKQPQEKSPSEQWRLAEAMTTTEAILSIISKYDDAYAYEISDLFYEEGNGLPAVIGIASYVTRHTQEWLDDYWPLPDDRSGDKWGGTSVEVMPVPDEETGQPSINPEKVFLKLHIGNGSAPVILRGEGPEDIEFTYDAAAKRLREHSKELEGLAKAMQRAANRLDAPLEFLAGI